MTNTGGKCKMWGKSEGIEKCEENVKCEENSEEIVKCLGIKWRNS